MIICACQATGGETECFPTVAQSWCFHAGLELQVAAITWMGTLDVRNSPHLASGQPSGPRPPPILGALWQTKAPMQWTGVASPPCLPQPEETHGSLHPKPDGLVVKYREQATQPWSKYSSLVGLWEAKRPKSLFWIWSNFITNSWLQSPFYIFPFRPWDLWSWNSWFLFWVQMWPPTTVWRTRAFP